MSAVTGVDYKHGETTFNWRGEDDDLSLFRPHWLREDGVKMVFPPLEDEAGIWRVVNVGQSIWEGPLFTTNNEGAVWEMACSS